MIPDNRPLTRRKNSLRLPGWDYTQPAYYFVTFKVEAADVALSYIVGDDTVLTDEGKILEEEWHDSPKHRPYIILDEYVIMPDHFHGIVLLKENENSVLSATEIAGDGKPRGNVPNSISALTGAIKSAASKRINFQPITPGRRVWQRSFFDHVIRKDETLSALRNYILDNPRNLVAKGISEKYIRKASNK